MFNWLKNLGKPKQTSTDPAFETVSYQGFDIYPEPKAEGGQYRLQGRIVKVIDQEPREYLLIRSDLLPSAELAAELMVAKAKRVIDENGERIFG
ncbi:HlyU family transcriptional regulator [Zobellella aerophila]|uniref:HlyU family transcriptional regulator n=1 Tax=Zobellella aerophila TaxID=870480 RepID=A0ABP6VNZ6_9GAMM